MKLTRSIQLLAAAATGVCFASIAYSQTLLAGWDFQTTTNGGTAGVASSTTVSSPLAYVANFGSGTLYLNGTNGSSTWTTGVTNPQVTGFGGTTVNAGTSFATATSGASALALANSSANGLFAVFAFSMAGYKDLTISYATQATATGFNLQTWEYSTNGTTWSALDTFNPKLGGSAATNFAGVGVVTLDTISGLDSIGSAFVRLSLTGASAAGGNNRFDNIQFTATAVPEPSSFAALAGVGALGFCALRRRRSV